jgi:hypothetical protein
VEKLIDNLDKINNFRKLKKNWNLYNAKKFNPKILDRSIEILNRVDRQPKVFPTSTSTVQLEYDYYENKYLEIEILSDLYYILKISNNKVEKEYETADLNQILEEIKFY